jgi:hypothetical protein
MMATKKAIKLNFFEEGIRKIIMSDLIIHKKGMSFLLHCRKHKKN